MLKKKRNILCMILMIISILGMIGTVYCAKKDLDHKVTEIRQDRFDEDPPEMLNENERRKEEVAENLKEPSNLLEDRDDHQGKIPSDMLRKDFSVIREEEQLSVGYIVIIGMFASLFSFSFLYLLMDYRYNKFYRNTDKLVIYVLSNVILITAITTGITFVTNHFVLGRNHSLLEEAEEKDPVDIDQSNIVVEGTIDLSHQNTDVTITAGGSYTFVGKFNHSIIVDSKDEEVEIMLNGVEITNEKTAAIIGLSAKKITIISKEGTENILNDGGNSEYDGCIFSNAELVFEGMGTLIVNGNQNEGEAIATETQNITFYNGTYLISSNDDGINAGGDGGTIFVMGSDAYGDAGIDTDTGYEINGGTVIALGSDMLETPLETSSQRSIAFTLTGTISKGTIVTLMKNDQVIISFESSKDFRTMMISSDTLEEGEYTLYQNGVNTGEFIHGIYQGGEYMKGDRITVNNQDCFIVSKMVNSFGVFARQ